MSGALVAGITVSPVRPAASSSALRSSGGASGARSEVGRTRWPSLMTLISNSPCLNVYGASAAHRRTGQAAAVASPAAPTMNLRRLIGGAMRRGSMIRHVVLLSAPGRLSRQG